MMPGLDGFELLRRLRAEPQRAPSRSSCSRRARAKRRRSRGYGAGADDYLTKPFSARELLARVETQLKLARLRARAENERERFYALLQQAPVPIAVYDGPELRVAYLNKAALAIPRADAERQDIRRGVPELVGNTLHEACVVYETGSGAPGRPSRSRCGPRGASSRRGPSICSASRYATTRAGHGRDRRGVRDHRSGPGATGARAQRGALPHDLRDGPGVDLGKEDSSAVNGVSTSSTRSTGPICVRPLEANPALVRAGRWTVVRVRDVNPATVRMFGASSRGASCCALAGVFDPAHICRLQAVRCWHRRRGAHVRLRRRCRRCPASASTSRSRWRSPDDRSTSACSSPSPTSRPRSGRARARSAYRRDGARRPFRRDVRRHVGHDLRNPLSAITTAAGLLAARADRTRPARPAACSPARVAWSA